MEFDNLEGLSVDQLEAMYDDNKDIISTWFGTHCGTKGFHGQSKCENAFSRNHPFCVLACDLQRFFTEYAFALKCENYCGEGALYPYAGAFGVAWSYRNGSYYSDCHFFVHGGDSANVHIMKYGYCILVR